MVHLRDFEKKIKKKIQQISDNLKQYYNTMSIDIKYIIAKREKKRERCSNRI